MLLLGPWRRFQKWSRHERAPPFPHKWEWNSRVPAVQVPEVCSPCHPHRVNVNIGSMSRSAPTPSTPHSSFFFFVTLAVLRLLLFTQRSRYLIRHLVTLCLQQALETEFDWCLESSSTDVNAPSDRRSATWTSRRCCRYHIPSCVEAPQDVFTLSSPLYGLHTVKVFTE